MTDFKKLYPCLSGQEAEVYHKRTVEGKSHTEIGKELGFTVTDGRCSTSESYLYRANKKIKACEETLKVISRR